jgi:hypothetical protein
MAEAAGIQMEELGLFTDLLTQGMPEAVALRQRPVRPCFCPVGPQALAPPCRVGTRGLDHLDLGVEARLYRRQRLRQCPALPVSCRAPCF